VTATRVLVLNSGSSSLKYQLLDPATGSRFATGLAERVGQHGACLTHTVTGAVAHTEAMPLADHAAALSAMLAAFDRHGPALEAVTAVGHRVVHGGRRFTAPVVVDDDVQAEIEALSPLAPLHNPANALGLRALRALLPQLPHVAVFDTAFHATIPDVAATYALPAELAARHGVRRYGFHGSSHAYVTRRTAALLGLPVGEVNLIICHIGNGASMTAVRGGRSVDTSMGMTPLEGLVMGTRCGDLDPGALLHLARAEGWSVDELDRVLNRESGLLGLCGASDSRAVHALADAGDARARLALDVAAYRMRKYIGAYFAVVPGVHAVVFTAGIGENDAELRAAVCGPLRHLGIAVDAAANAARSHEERFVDDGTGSVRVLVVPTDEEAEIAAQAAALAGPHRSPASGEDAETGPVTSTGRRGLVVTSSEAMLDS
jgi:acetate kinase